MDKQKSYHRIAEVSDKIRRLGQDVTAMQYIDVADDENYCNLLIESAIRGEFIVKNLRQLVFDTTDIPKGEYLANAATALDISITENNGTVEITLPCLIPRRKTKATDFIIAPLQEILSRFVSSRKPRFERFKHCVICFTHVYDKSMLRRRHGGRDHDNIEIKPIIDTINLFLLTDDTGSLCNIYNSCEIADRDMTRISIMKRDMFSAWILNQKSMS
jgi:hypothetical protein